MYTTEPAKGLRPIVEHVRPGGVVDFQEPELAPWLGYVTCGSTPLAHQIYKWASAAFESTGVHSSMSSVLYAAYRGRFGRAADGALCDDGQRCWLGRVQPGRGHGAERLA